MATPALDTKVRLRSGNSSDLDDVMEVMNAAFGDRFGEAWTRSQCAGILPMHGVGLVIARDVDTGKVVGFSLLRTVAGESELLLLGVLPSRHREGIGGRLLEDFVDRARGDGAFTSRCGKATRRSICIAMLVSRLLAGAATITTRLTEGASTH